MAVAVPVIVVTPEAVIVPEVAVAIAVKSVAAALPVTVTVKSSSIDDNSDDIKRQEGLWDMLNVFYSYMGNGKYEPSKEMLEDNLNERHASLGDNHPETQRAMHNLGLYHLEEGRYQVAKEIEYTWQKF